MEVLFGVLLWFFSLYLGLTMWKKTLHLLVWMLQTKIYIKGLHFVISLCLYDGMLSLVQLAHGSLLAGFLQKFSMNFPDITISSEDRAKCNMYSSIFGSIGANSVFASHLFWDKQGISTFRLSKYWELRSFRIYCLLVAVIAFIAFEITAIGLDTK